jgi:uncharacterized membrane protein
MTTRPADGRAFERRLGRLLTTVTYVAVGLLTVGVILMLQAGISPLAGGPPFDLAQLVPDLRALEPAGFLWLGLLAVIATPLSRVVGAAIGFARRGEPLMAVISVAILTVIAISVLAAQASD